MHPLDQLRGVLEFDFAVLSHCFAPHGRDYVIVVQDGVGADPGEHELIFTHCVRADYETRVRDEVWSYSWADEFTDYQRWLRAGRREGYVWGSNWSLAYPGLLPIPESPVAAEWSRRLGKDMFEMTLETDRFFLRLIFHSLRARKMSENTATVSRVIVPLPGPANEVTGASAEGTPQLSLWTRIARLWR
jgi:hypothetical protein